MSLPTERPVQPLFVALDDVAADSLHTEALGAGWQLVSDPACAGRGRLLDVRHLAPGDVEVVVRAVSGGAGVLVAAAGAADDLVDELLEDLSRFGRVTVVRAADVPDLDVETWRLLHALRDGATVSEAARSLHVSLRTANRRLAQARAGFATATRGELLRAISRPDRIAPAD